MAKKVDSKFLVIEATAEEFMNIGFGGGPVEDLGIVAGGVFAGFSMISIGGGERMCCDVCNKDIKAEDTCYYVAVLNQVMCKKCFEGWHRSAKFYPEDVPFEKRNFENIQHKLEVARIGFDAV